MPGAMAKSKSVVKQVGEHARFFDSLVDLVPAKFYLESEYEPVNKYTHSKSERAHAKQVAKEGHKLKKLAKLDPDQVHTSTAEIKRRAEQSKAEREGGEGDEEEGDSDEEMEEEVEDSESEEEEEEEEEGGKGKGKLGGGAKAAKLPTGGDTMLFGNGLSLTGSVSRDQLQERLAKRINDYRDKRNAQEKHDTAQKAREWRKQASSRKQDKKAKGEDKGAAAGQAGGKGGAAGKKRAAGGDAADLEFSRVDLGNKELGPKGRLNNKKQKVTKEELLQQAEERVKRAGELAGTEEGRQEKLKNAWGGALQRAAGNRVLDNPKLLRKSIKNDEKRKDKSRKKWDERKKVETEGRAKTQKRRNDNLKNRAQAKIQRKKDKREKKLLRPGFEGRKDTMINMPKKRDGDNLTVATVG